MAAARRLHPKEGSGEPESGKRTRVRSHARSTWRSPAAQNRLLPRCRQRSQVRTRKASVSLSVSSSKYIPTPSLRRMPGWPGTRDGARRGVRGRGRCASMTARQSRGGSHRRRSPG
ncbi:hypothetical protein OsJ_07013 [Oryza sativa Japonica Group]|uniref:Uncharacterized protein n=1 Tax=Oryza sativa subsp. japonica TaxID=39947 RepID=A3A7M7_ORYSJ|nr:hypothetical protein OsJ_07013 [Oryza sativa Japonica Group]